MYYEVLCFVEIVFNDDDIFFFKFNIMYNQWFDNFKLEMLSICMWIIN